MSMLHFTIKIPENLPGFHDAIGDAISISITPKHLQGLGLIQKSVDDTAHDINFLFSMAMDKVRKLLCIFQSADNVHF